MKKKLHPAWIVLVGMMLIQAGTMGIVFNCMGILFAAILNDLGFRAGDLSLYYTIRSISGAVTVGITTKLFFKYNPRVVMSVLGCMYVGSIGIMGCFDSLWQWYVDAIICGIGMSCTLIVIPLVLSNWFNVKKGLVIGVTMSASGIAGALFSPVCSNLINQLGWRLTAVLMAVIGFCMIVIPSYFMLRVRPEEIGCKPYGTEADSTIETVPKPSSKTSHEVAKWVFPLTLVAFITTNTLVQFNAQLPTFSMSVGYSISMGATLTSLSMVGNVVGKLAMGALTDYLGIYRTVKMFLVAIAVAMLIFLFGSGIQAFLYVAAFTFGLVYAVGAMAPSLLYLNLYGPERCRDKLSSMQSISAIIAAFLGAAVPYTYDITGSFDMVLIVGVLACTAVFFIFGYLQRYVNNNTDIVYVPNQT